jgi:hypothetical protein
MIYQRAKELGINDYAPIEYDFQRPEGLSSKWLFLPKDTQFHNGVMAWPSVQQDTCSHHSVGMKTSVPSSGVSDKAKKWNRTRACLDRYTLGIIPWEHLSEKQQKHYRNATENGAKPWKVQDTSLYATELHALGIQSFDM